MSFYVWTSGISAVYSIALVGTPFRVGDKADELFSFHMAPPNQPVQPVPTPISNSATSKPTTAKKRKSDDSGPSGHDDNWPRCIVLTGTTEKPISKISPFAIHKTIEGVAGQVKNVTKMRNGNLLIESRSRGQSNSLLSIEKVLQFDV